MANWSSTKADKAMEKRISSASGVGKSQTATCNLTK